MRKRQYVHKGSGQTTSIKNGPLLVSLAESASAKLPLSFARVPGTPWPFARDTQSSIDFPHQTRLERSDRSSFRLRSPIQYAVFDKRGLHGCVCRELK